MKNLKTILTVFIMAFAAFSCTSDDDSKPINEDAVDLLNGDILFTIGDQTAAYNDAQVIFDSLSGWTTITAQHQIDSILVDSITFSFEGNTPGEYERFDENVQGNYTNGNYFYVVYKSELGWMFRYKDLKTNSLLISEIGQNVGDHISGTFRGLIEVDGVDVDFIGEFNFLR